MLKKYLDVSNWTRANIADINIESPASAIFKSSIISYGTIRLRIKDLLNERLTSGETVLDWQQPIVTEVSRYIEDWTYSILRKLRVECTDPFRAGAYFYHRLYSAVSQKRALACIHPDMCDGAKPEEFDELVRLVFMELPYLYNK